MQVTKQGIERIKGANDLAAVIAERGIEVKRKGRQVVALCPWHAEKTPSLTLTPSKGLFHCFGCGASGDVIGFITKYDKVSFGGALEILARRAGLDLSKLMEERPRLVRTPLDALTPPPDHKDSAEGAPREGAPPGAILSRVVEHYHRTFCERADAQEYLNKRGLTDADLLRALKVGYADGSLLKVIPKAGDVRKQLVLLGVITPEGRELLGGCVVVPIPDALTGQWTNLYGRGLRTPRHCYLPGSFRGVLNFQAARLSPEVILTESVLDALSFHQAGISTAIPIYGTNGFTPDHLDTLKREGVKRVILALDNDEPGKKATEAIKEKLTAAGITVRVAAFPAGLKDANELLVSRNGDASEAFRQVLDAAEPRSAPPAQVAAPAAVSSPPLIEKTPTEAAAGDGPLTLTRDGLTYHARVQSTFLGRLRVTVKVARGDTFHVDTIDIYASRSRTEFARRASKILTTDVETIESDLLAVLVLAEKVSTEDAEKPVEVSAPQITESERTEAIAFLKCPDLLDQIARDIDTLGYVGEETIKKLLYLIAVSRKSEDPGSAVILSQSGAGKSGASEVVERLTPPEDVVLVTRLTPQSLYYLEPGALDHKLVVIEERHGSMEADYSVRVLQSRKKLSVLAAIKDPSTGNMTTRKFEVEARAAFIEATTRNDIDHENSTRCFELTMDESEEQTRRIHERQRLMRTEEGLRLRREAAAIIRRHWNAQRLLEPLPVVIPFADKLTFPTAWMRTRRDHARFLNLIEVSAFLHQYQRERKAGAIVATVADYEVAYGLAGEVLKDTLSDLKAPLRRALTRIRGLAERGNGTVSRREIREALAEPDSTVRRWLLDLVDLEYLAVVEAGRQGQGKTTRYAFVDRPDRAERIAGLLTPEELRARI